VVTFDRQEDK